MLSYYCKPLAPYYDRNCINIPVHPLLCYCMSKTSLLFSVYDSFEQSSVSKVGVKEFFQTRNEDILGYSSGEVWYGSV